MSQSAGHGEWRFLLSSSAGQACFWLKAAGSGGSCVLKRRTGLISLGWGRQGNGSRVLKRRTGYIFAKRRTRYFFAGCGLATGVCSAFFTLFRSMVLVSRMVM